MRGVRKSLSPSACRARAPLYLRDDVTSGTSSLEIAVRTNILSTNVPNGVNVTCNDVIVHRNRRTPERSNDPRSAPRGFRIDHIVQIFEIQMNREHMEPKCCPPMGPPPSGSPSHTVKRAGAPGCARSAPALRAGRRVALAQELWSQTYTARPPCPSWCVTARDRASRAFVEADPGLTSLKWVNTSI